MVTTVQILLLFFLLFDFHAMISEATLCEAPSTLFSGLCFSDHNCETICNKEGFSNGTCKFLKCICAKDCNVGGSGSPSQGPPVEGPPEEGPPGGEEPPQGGDEAPAEGPPGGEEPPANGPAGGEEPPPEGPPSGEGKEPPVEGRPEGEEPPAQGPTRGENPPGAHRKSLILSSSSSSF